MKLKIFSFIVALFWGIDHISAQLPNLVMSAVSFNAGTIHPGDYLNFSFKISNTGSANANTSHTKLFLSTNLSYTNAILLSEISNEALLPLQETGSINCSIPVPYNITAGNYYLLIKVDSRNEVAESNENNDFHSIFTVTVNSTPNRQQSLPYPIIFIHGFSSDNTTWDTIKSAVQQKYGWSFGGNMNFCLNQDGNTSTSNLATDYKDWTKIDSLYPADFYTVNFNTDTSGNTIVNGGIFGLLESNQAAAVKQGLAIRDAVKHVLSKTGRNKVILVGHSMGGLASREYLQNNTIWQSDGQHHVAKLLTLGTPHGGSDFSAGGLIGYLVGLDEYSEAVRDLRTTYYWSGDSGVYLFGGKEKYSVMNNSLFFNYSNADVNCNGIDADNSTIVGINHKPIPTDLFYTSVIGDYGGSGSDQIVTTFSANFNNFRNVNADTFYVNATHTTLTEQTSTIIKGMDEPHQSDLSYNISIGSQYYGNFTQQSVGLASSMDSDFYRFNVAQAGLLNIELFNLPVSNVIAKIYSSNGNLLFTNNSSGKSYINFSGISVQPGNYFCLIAGTPDNLSWQYAYGLKIGYNPPVILPINDLEFTATAFQNNAVDLLLKKASTNVFEKYELQHSINSYDWLSIDSTSSSNLINGIYQYRDLHPSFTFANLYRVKTTMENGVVKYSMIRTVTFNGTIPPISVFPNPAHHFTQIRINIKHPKTSLIISDISGRVIYQQVLNETSPDLITVPTTLFSNGYYIVRMLDDQINYCEKLIVLRN